MTIPTQRYQVFGIIVWLTACLAFTIYVMDYQTLRASADLTGVAVPFQNELIGFVALGVVLTIAVLVAFVTGGAWASLVSALCWWAFTANGAKASGPAGICQMTTFSPGSLILGALFVIALLARWLARSWRSFATPDAQASSTVSLTPNFDLSCSFGFCFRHKSPPRPLYTKMQGRAIW
jgi:hypothetical protein